jgi:hypothetical protein
VLNRNFFRLKVCMPHFNSDHCRNGAAYPSAVTPFDIPSAGRTGAYG